MKAPIRRRRPQRSRSLWRSWRRRCTRSSPSLTRRTTSKPSLQVRADDPAVRSSWSNRRKRLPVDIATPLSRALAGLDVRTISPRAACYARPPAAGAQRGRRRRGAGLPGAGRSARSSRPTSWAACPPPCSVASPTDYATIELAGQHRRAWRSTKRAPRANRRPVYAASRQERRARRREPGDDAFHTQTALLEKINAALAIDLRLSEQTNQFQLSARSSSSSSTTSASATPRRRLMNATIHQWRYGQAYGEDLFSHTAADIDGWRPF